MEKALKKTAILICGHGSRDNNAAIEFSKIAEGLQKRYPDTMIEYGFLEFSKPNIHMALDKLASSGATQILAVPGMLLAATHAKNDIPSVLMTYMQKHKSITIKYGRELGIDSKIIEAFEDRILTSLCKTPKDDLTDAMLVVVGRGTSDVQANSDVCKIARIVNENLGFGWADVVYSGVTYPSTGIGLEMLAKLGFKTIVVAPYFLFTGKLINRIEAYVDEVQQKLPAIKFIKAKYLNDHAKVIDAFVDRIEELKSDRTPELTLMEDFKQRLKAGKITIHHHHSEFSATEQPIAQSDDTHSHSHSDTDTHSHSHSHSDTDTDLHSHSHSDTDTDLHSHETYKHIAHPLGPRTMIGTKNCCCFMGQFPKWVIDEEQKTSLKNKAKK